MIKIKKKGQSVIEYSVILIIIMGALLASSNYFKRGLQGRWKQSVDELADQYDPRVANSSFRHTLRTNTITAVTSLSTPSGLLSTRNDISSGLETRTGFINVGAF